MFGKRKKEQMRALVDRIGERNCIVDDIASNGDGTASALRSAINGIGSALDDILYNTNSAVAEATKLDAEISKIKLMTKKQKMQTERIATSSEEMSQTIIDISRNSSTASEEARNAVSIVEQSRAKMERTTERISSVITSTEALKASIENLTKRTQEVEEVISFIKDVADQTNLLALNAAIEAARAGEQGRGFAVVADEVRKLAERTTKATDDIGRTLNRIKDETAVTNTSMKASMVEVEASRHEIDALRVSFGEVIDHVQLTHDNITKIATAVEEQSAATEEVAQSVEDTLKMAVEIDRDADTLMKITDTVHANANAAAQAIEQFKFEPGRNSLMERVKADHRLWVKRLYRMYHGLEKIDKVGGHRECRLGKWYYSEASQAVQHMPAFRELERPHEQLHTMAQQCVDMYNRGQRDQCLQNIAEIERISNEVVARLDALKHG